MTLTATTRSDRPTRPDRPARPAGPPRPAHRLDRTPWRRHARRRVTSWWTASRRRLRPLGLVAARAREAGTTTAEYAVATLAACGFAGLLLVIMRSGEVRGLLLGIVRRALAVG